MMKRSVRNRTERGQREKKVTERGKERREKKVR